MCESRPSANQDVTSSDMKRLCRAFCLWLAECCEPEPQLRKYHAIPRDGVRPRQRELLRRLARKLDA